MKLQKNNRFGNILLIVALTMMGLILTGCPNPVVNHAPTFSVNLPSTSSVQAGSTLNLSVTITDSDGDAISYTWEKSSNNGTTWTGVGTNSSSYAFSETVAGTYKVRIVGDDGKGGSITSTVCTVTVTAVSTPSVTLADLGGPYTSPANFNVDANVDLAGKTVSTAKVYAGATEMGNLTYQSGTLYRYSATNVPAGSYVLKAVVVFTDTTTVESSTKSVTVNPAATYSVTYDGNGNTGGSVPIDTNNYGAGNTVTVKSNEGTLVKTGHTFNNWNTKTDGTGTAYVGGNTFIINANTTLYAQWTVVPTTYTVTFNSNGGTTVSSITGISSGSKITAPTAPTKSGFTFENWYKEASLTNVWNFSTDTVTSNLTLYAKWTAILAELKFYYVRTNLVYKMVAGAGNDQEITGFDNYPTQLNIVNGEFYYVFNNLVYKMVAGAGNDQEITGFDNYPTQLNIE